MANELSELQGIDFALGAHIAKAFDDRINPNVGPKQFREFLGRDTNKQIYRHDTDSPKQFMKAVRRSAKKKRTEGQITVNLPDLPIIAYSRKPGLTNGEQRKFINVPVAWNDDETKAFNLTILPATVTYTMMFLAWDKPSLDAMQIAWYAFICDPTQKNKSFYVRYRIGSEDIENVEARIVDRRTLLFTDRSLPIGEGRLFAVDHTIEIMTQVLFGAEIAEPVIEADIEGYLAGYCHDWPRD